MSAAHLPGDAFMDPGYCAAPVLIVISAGEPREYDSRRLDCLLHGSDRERSVMVLNVARKALRDIICCP